MCEISVIMSVYNESISEINASVDSIINQTFNDFELIIIIDNPARQELKINLEKRIHVLGFMSIKLIWDWQNQ